MKSRSNIRQIIVHCTGSDREQDDPIEVIREWHLARGWDDIGYHLYIPKNFEKGIQMGRSLHTIGAHCLGQNLDSVGICLSGNHEFHQHQLDTLVMAVQILSAAFKIEKVFPHNFYNPGKTCPNFDIYDLPQLKQYEKARDAV